MKSYTTTMTEGSELRHILLFTLPLLSGNLFQQLYNIVDSVIVGKYLGATALAAVGATGSLTFLFYSLCMGLGAGTGILVAQYFGAGDDKSVKKYIANSAYVITAFGIVLTVLSVILAPHVLRLMKTPDSVIDAATSYMQINCAGTIAVAAYNWINSVMRSLGNSRIPLIFLIVASVLNVALDLLFVIVFDMGVNGAALATITAQAASAVSCIAFALIKIPQFRLTRTDLAFNGHAVKQCVATGVPISLQSSLIAVSMIYLQSTANTFGDTVMAAYTATMRVEQLVQQPFGSLSAALSTFAGQNLGAGKPERCITGYKASMKVMTAFAILMLAVFMLFGANIVGCFVDEPEVIEIGAAGLKLSACFYFFLGMIHTTRGLLNGAGDVGYAMVNGFAEVAGRIGFATMLVMIPAVGCWAVWATSGLTWLITGVMSVLRYRSGKWKLHVKLPAQPPAKPRTTTA